MNLYKRLFARSLANGDSFQDTLYGSKKEQLLKKVHGKVLEIGAGTGVNLPYIPDSAQWTGIEPNPYMHRFIHEKAEELNLAVNIQIGDACNLSFADGYFDSVISTLVLCSVKDPIQAVQEIKRVLKPGGLFIFIEHVVAPPSTFLRTIQKCIKPAWMLVADGCRPDRDLQHVIEQAGFSELHIESFDSPFPVYVIKPHIMGWAVC